jgi:hypothetical protein
MFKKATRSNPCHTAPAHGSDQASDIQLRICDEEYYTGQLAKVNPSLMKLVNFEYIDTPG